MKGPTTRWDLTSAQGPSRRQVAINGLTAAADVLSFCAQQDPYAGQFLKTVNVFKDMLKTQEALEPEQRQNHSVGRSHSRPEESLGSEASISTSSAEAAHTRVPTNSVFTPSTVSSSFDSITYSNTGNFSVPSLSYAQYTLTQHFESQLAQNGPRLDAYPMTFEWNPSNTVGLHPVPDLRRNLYEESSDSTRHHYPPFLQDY